VAEEFPDSLAGDPPDFENTDRHQLMGSMPFFRLGLPGQRPVEFVPRDPEGLRHFDSESTLESGDPDLNF